LQEKETAQVLAEEIVRVDAYIGPGIVSAVGK